MSDSTSTQIWRMAAGLLAASLLTGASAFVIQSKEAVNRKEVSKMIKCESPYVVDRSMVLQQLEDIKTQIGQINMKLDRRRK